MEDNHKKTPNNDPNGLEKLDPNDQLTITISGKELHDLLEKTQIEAFIEVTARDSFFKELGTFKSNGYGHITASGILEKNFAFHNGIDMAFRKLEQEILIRSKTSR